jgi:hypothetical protein
MDEHVFAAVIANDKAKTLLTIEELHDTLGRADYNAGAHVTRGTRAAKAAATGTTTKSAAATGTTAEAAATAAEAITAAATIAAAAATAETITTAAAIAAAFKLVEPALALVETTTTPGTTSASIKAHFLSKSSIVSTRWCSSAAMRRCSKRRNQSAPRPKLQEFQRFGEA